MSSITKPIIISGSGPSGLLLAHGLKNANIPFHVFERDAALGMRAQGYRFKLTGPAIDSLTSILSPEHFALLRNSGGSFRNLKVYGFNAITGESLQVPGDPQARSRPAFWDETHEPISADRTLFRRVLYKGLEADVTFNKEIVSYELEDDGVSVNFSDGESMEGSLLVGADGSWSKIRRQLLPSVELLDSEGRSFYGKTTITPELRESFNSGAMKGLTLVQDASQEPPVTLLLEPMIFDNHDKVGDLILPKDYVYWVVAFRMDRFDTSRITKHPTPEQCVKSLQKLTKDWDPSFKPLFDLQDFSQTSILQIGITATPIPQWQSTGRVTLIGDAIHAMPPTGGIGATTALRDVGVLLKVLTEEGLSAESLTKYENEMRAYAADAINLSHMGGQKFFGIRPMGELKPFEQ
ncbi:hypothetical protein MMC10_002813 [Thelotrema lepadinum]|nr:hypothetical protein [Thelotrema lepadinum]